MARRVTIMIDEGLDKKIRGYQVKKIQKENTSYSYSRAINDMLKKAPKLQKYIFSKNNSSLLIG